MDESTIRDEMNLLRILYARDSALLQMIEAYNKKAQEVDRLQKQVGKKEEKNEHTG